MNKDIDKNKNIKDLDDNNVSYKKKKQSSISKSKEKSKHKHEYVDCLLIDRNNCPHRSEYCKICGKISDLKFYETERIENGMFRVLDHDEVLKKYKDLERFYIDSIWDKFIVLNNDIKEEK